MLLSSGLSVSKLDPTRWELRPCAVATRETRHDRAAGDTRTWHRRAAPRRGERAPDPTPEQVAQHMREAEAGREKG